MKIEGFFVFVPKGKRKRNRARAGNFLFYFYTYIYTYKNQITTLPYKNMLGLKLATDPRWVNIVESNISEILTDHAYCEQKATSNAIYLIVNFPEHTDLVTDMIKLAQEELGHFEMV